MSDTIRMSNTLFEGEEAAARELTHLAAQFLDAAPEQREALALRAVILDRFVGLCDASRGILAIRDARANCLHARVQVLRSKADLADAETKFQAAITECSDAHREVLQELVAKGLLSRHLVDTPYCDLHPFEQRKLDSEPGPSEAWRSRAASNGLDTLRALKEQKRTDLDAARKTLALHETHLRKLLDENPDLDNDNSEPTEAV